MDDRKPNLGNADALHAAFSRQLEFVRVRRPPVRPLPDDLAAFRALRDIHLGPLDPDSFPKPPGACEREPYEPRHRPVKISGGTFIAPDAPHPGVGMDQPKAQGGNAPLPLHLFNGWWEHSYAADNSEVVEITARMSWTMGGTDDVGGVEPGLYRVLSERDITCAFGYRLEPSQHGRASIDVHSAVYAGQGLGASTNPVIPIRTVLSENAASGRVVVDSRMACLSPGYEFQVEIQGPSSSAVVAVSVTTFRLEASGGGRASLMIWTHGIVNRMNSDPALWAGDTVFHATKIKDIEPPPSTDPEIGSGTKPFKCALLCEQQCDKQREKTLLQAEYYMSTNKPLLHDMIEDLEVEIAKLKKARVLLGCGDCSCP